MQPGPIPAVPSDGVTPGSDQGAGRTLERQLSARAATALVVGQVIAVGIFLTPGTIIRTVASPLWILVVWGLTGVMTMCGALCFGALAARYPQAGGPYIYLREAFGPRIAFLYGWKCLLVMDPGITAALATGFASYVAWFVPLGSAGVRAVAVAAMLGLAAVHIVGLKPGARLLAVLSALKLALIAVLVVAAVASPSGNLANFTPFVDRHAGAPPFGGALAGALLAAFFCFAGWWEVTKMAGEARDPGRTLPRALRDGLAIVTLVYIVTTLSFVYVMPVERVGAGETFVAQVGTALFGTAGGRAIAAVILVCVLGSLGAMLMFAPRLYVAMARDRAFPAAVAALHPRLGTPARSIALQAALASVLVLLGTFDTIVAYFIFVTVAFVALTVAGVFVLRRRDRTFHVPGHPWTAAIFLLMVGGLLALLALNNPLQAALGVALVALGVPVYTALKPVRSPAQARTESQT